VPETHTSIRVTLYDPENRAIDPKNFRFESLVRQHGVEREALREHAELARFNGRLAALGSAAEPLPECPSEITEIISSRLQWLHVQQKI
jgi:hypothetical protein